MTDERVKAMSGWCLTGQHDNCTSQSSLWVCSCPCHEAGDKPTTMEV